MSGGGEPRAEERARGRQPRDRGGRRHRARRHARGRRAGGRHGQAARSRTGRATDVEKRAAILAKAADLIEEHAKELAAMLTSEQGKPLAEACGEVTHLAHGVRYYAEAATKVRGAYQELPSTLGPAYGMVIRRPIGVCAAITPYNFPLTLLGHEGRAGAGGGQHGRRQARRRRRRWRRSRSRGCSPRPACPTACSTSSPAAAPTIGDALVGHPDVRRVAFTGSTARRPPRRCARRPGAQARDARARRLGPRDRVRRRRRRRRGQGRDHRPLLERRARRAWAASACSSHDAVYDDVRRRSSSTASAATSPATARSRPRSRGCGWARSTPARAATSCSSRSRTASPRAASC